HLVGDGGFVFAFEPIPSVARRLASNAFLNHLEKIVRISQLALGEDSREVTFHLRARSSANQGMSSKSRFPEAVEQILVQQTSLDDWFENQPVARLDFLKMDIEGGELDMLSGARKTIGKYKPIILTEASSPSVRSLWTWLNAEGYDVFHLSGGRLN